MKAYIVEHYTEDFNGDMALSQYVVFLSLLEAEEYYNIQEQEASYHECQLVEMEVGVVGSGNVLKQ
jgi:hypothetical protein